MDRGERLGVIFGIVIYVAYFIKGFIDNDHTTPKEILGGIHPWDWYYYPVVIIEYIVLYPLWHLFSKYIFGGLFSGVLRNLEEN
jgi:hypothetical protein